MSTARKKKARWLLWLFMIALVFAGIAVYKTFGPNTGTLQGGEYLYIKTGSTYSDVQRDLTEGGFIKDMTTFNLLAKYANLPSHMYAGRYEIKSGMSNYDIIIMLRSGRKSPPRIVINKLRTKNDFVRIISTNLEADSNELYELLRDNSFLKDYDLDSNTALCAVIPDTYEFYWNTSAKEAYKKIAANYTRFWNEQRKQKAASKNLTPAKVSIIASIVDEETNMNAEKPNVASVYLNRLRIGMRLQADPTVKFANNDPTIRRITRVHLQYISPYNTYIYAGLPPGPICTPSKASLKAVLNAPDTKYIYFCAKEDFSGYHNFATNIAEHNQNARRYQRALNERGIK